MNGMEERKDQEFMELLKAYFKTADYLHDACNTVRKMIEKTVKDLDSIEDEILAMEDEINSFREKFIVGYQFSASTIPAPGAGGQGTPEETYVPSIFSIREFLKAHPGVHGDIPLEIFKRIEFNEEPFDRAINRFIFKKCRDISNPTELELETVSKIAHVLSISIVDSTFLFRTISQYL